MGYHKTEIPRGILGEASKIEEEFLEFKDALAQKNAVMALCELSDLIGAIAAYVKKQHKGTISLDDLLKMTHATEESFQSGRRK